jgi:hypothetical protein
MSIQIIPLTSDSIQQFQVNISVNNVILNLALTVEWNRVGGYWVMSVTNVITGILLLDSIPLICGNYPAANILGPYLYLNIGAAYIINASGVPLDIPGENDLGTDFVLFWTDNQAV